MLRNKRVRAYYRLYVMLF